VRCVLLGGGVGIVGDLLLRVSGYGGVGSHRKRSVSVHRHILPVHLLVRVRLAGRRGLG
jgi:hypothetical protein